MSFGNMCYKGWVLWTCVTKDESFDESQGSNFPEAIACPTPHIMSVASNFQISLKHDHLLIWTISLLLMCPDLPASTV